MTKSKYDIAIHAALGRVNVENIDALAAVLTAFEDKWKDELPVIKAPDKVMRHQGRCLGVRDILCKMKRAAE